MHAVGVEPREQRHHVGDVGRQLRSPSGRRAGRTRRGRRRRGRRRGSSPRIARASVSKSRPWRDRPCTQTSTRGLAGSPHSQYAMRCRPRASRHCTWREARLARGVVRRSSFHLHRAADGRGDLAPCPARPAARRPGADIAAACARIIGAGALRRLARRDVDLADRCSRRSRTAWRSSAGLGAVARDRLRGDLGLDLLAAPRATAGRRRGRSSCVVMRPVSWPIAAMSRPSTMSSARALPAGDAALVACSAGRARSCRSARRPGRAAPPSSPRPARRRAPASAAPARRWRRRLRCVVEKVIAEQVLGDLDARARGEARARPAAAACRRGPRSGRARARAQRQTAASERERSKRAFIGGGLAEMWLEPEL